MKRAVKKANAPAGFVKKAGRVAAGFMGAGSTEKGGGGTRRRHKSANYWANKVLVEKLKRKYQRLKFGGR